MPLQYKRVEVFTSEEARWKGRPLFEAIVHQVHSLKIAARCMVSRGIAGCFENGDISSQKIEVLSLNMPLKIEIILPAAELDRVLPAIEEMVMDGIVVVEDMEIRAHRTRRRLIPKHLLVRDAMTPSPQTVSPSMPVNQVIRLLLASRFHGVPVVDDQRRVLGIITQRDLIARAGMPVRLGLLARLEQELVAAHLESLAQKTAEEIMTRPVVTTIADKLLTEAVDQLLKQDLKRLPVVDGEDRLVGMLSRVDIFRTVAQQTPDWQTLEAQQVLVQNIRFVRDIMQRDVHTVRPETPIQEVIRLIDANDIQRVAVVDEDGRFLGLIFDHDLLTAFSEHPLGLWDYFASKLSFTEMGRKHREFVQRVQARTAGEIMQREIITVQEDASIEEMIRLIVEKQLKRLPVVDAGGLFLGMISRDAILRAGAIE